MVDVNKNDPLEGLLVDETTDQNRARELLASILKGRVEIKVKTGELELLSGAYKISVADTILLLLCGRLAQKLLSDKINKKSEEFNEKMSQGDIVKSLVTVEAGTIKSSLHNLRNASLIKNEEGKNFVAFSQLQKINDRLSGKNVEKL